MLSKVDAHLIEIHPIEVQPRTLIENAIKMFAAELAANKAKMTLEIEQSFHDLAVRWVKLDPGRLLQILINLCTNAIKFTMDSHIRKITITIGASSVIPTHSTRGVRYLHGVGEESFEALEIRCSRVLLHSSLGHQQSPAELFGACQIQYIQVVCTDC